MGRWATAGGPLLHECPHVVDRSDGAGQVAIDQIVGEQGDRRRIVDLREDELEGRRLERDRDDPVAVGHRREIGRRRVRLGRVAHVLGDAQEQVVLGLARDQEVPGRGEEVFDVGVPPQLHARSIRVAPTDIWSPRRRLTGSVRTTRPPDEGRRCRRPPPSTSRHARRRGGSV